jgi:predicted ABC-type sugar transport system permease subunit
MLGDFTRRYPSISLTILTGNDYDLALARELFLQLRHWNRRAHGEVVISPFAQTWVVQSGLPEVKPGIMLKLNRHHPRRQAGFQQVSQQIKQRREDFEWIGNNYLGPVPWLVVIALAVIAVCWFILRRTTLGVHIYAVGGNMQAARLTGIKVWMVLLFVYGMSGLLSGLGGVMSASRLYSANGNLGTGYELDAIAAVILGGTSFVGGIGTITGTLVGALIIATLNNGMTLMGVSYFWQLVIKGAVIIIAVLIDKYRTRHHQSA